MEQKPIRISELWIYPVKSLRGVRRDAVRLTKKGLAFDREWMITDDGGNFITQRQYPELARISVEIRESELVLKSGRLGSVSVPLNPEIEREKLMVRIWGDELPALDEGGEVAAWLGKSIGKLNGRTLRLVRFDPDAKRSVNAEYLLPDEHSDQAFPDGYPFLITNQRSLDRLNDALIEKSLDKITMDRFRANIVVNGPEPFWENARMNVTVSDSEIVFGLRKPCGRCKVITVNQQNGDIPVPGEPLRTLAELGNVPGKKGAFFGQNAILLKGDGKEVRVGDEIVG